MNTPLEVAQWMIDQLMKDKVLYQAQIVNEISEKFQPDYTYVNNNGNLSISEEVRKEFRKMGKGKGVIWDNYEKCWRIP